MSKHNTKKNIIALLSIGAITCTFVAIVVMLLGGLSYANPHLDFTDLFDKHAFKKMVYIIIPSIY